MSGAIREERQRKEATADSAPLQWMSQSRRMRLGSRRVFTLQADTAGNLYAEGARTFSLTVATSCLVQPLAGDRVCVIFDGALLVITEILSRREMGAALTLTGGGSALRIVAPEIEMHGTRKIKLQSLDFTLLTRSGRWVSDTLQQISRRLFVRSGHASRRIEQTDEVQAKHIVQDAEQSLVIKSEIGSLNASAVLKIDGGQIHVG